MPRTRISFFKEQKPKDALDKLNIMASFIADLSNLGYPMTDVYDENLKKPMQTLKDAYAHKVVVVNMPDVTKVSKKKLRKLHAIVAGGSMMMCDPSNLENVQSYESKIERVCIRTCSGDEDIAEFLKRLSELAREVGEHSKEISSNVLIEQ